MNDSIHLDNTRKYIRLFQMQLHGVLEDMAQPAEKLSSIFSDSLIRLHDVKDALNKDDEVDVAQINNQVQEVIKELFECVSCMQFVDSKRQRIEHVADGLNYLIGDEVHNISVNYDWNEINTKIVGQYKMSKERLIYEKYLSEINIEENNDVVAEGNL